MCWGGGGGWAGASEGWVAGKILIINFYAGPCFYFGEEEKESSFFGMPRWRSSTLAMHPVIAPLSKS